MGQDVSSNTSTLVSQQQYRRKVRRCLDALARMLTEERFSVPPKQIGLELELNLIDDACDPAMANGVVLEKIDDPSFTTELGQHNLEINMKPRQLAGDEITALERDLRTSLGSAEAKARDAGTALVMIGMLPTLRAEHFDVRWLSPVPRYSALNDKIFSVRGEQLLLEMEGNPLPGHAQESLHAYAASIVPESACTSAQLHLEVAPEDFAAHWNAAQCLAGVQVALAANSPFLMEKALWHETRIPLFQQSTDTRPEELRNQGVRPRVWFGERWITSIFDLFEENVRYFPGLLPEVDAQDPLEELDADRTPKLAEMRLHNGTIWRWNRPVYDIRGGEPHLRVENRVLPAGPTVIDLMANAALFYGAQRALVNQERPVWSQLSFAAAEENFYAGARHGMDARIYWPGSGWSSADELVLRKLLPLAHEGLADYGMGAAARERYLGVIEQRCLSRRTGAAWQRDNVSRRIESGQDRTTALRGMLGDYVELMRAGEPVHTWPIAG